jgi:hypothetical protein
MTGNGTVDASHVARTVGVTLAIAAAIDFLSGYFGWRIPWYATTSVLTLFMYACESNLNYQDRLASNYRQPRDP